MLDDRETGAECRLNVTDEIVLYGVEGANGIKHELKSLVNFNR